MITSDPCHVSPCIYLFIHLQIIAKKILKILIEYSINKYKKLCHKEIFVMKTMTEYSVIIELCPITCVCVCPNYFFFKKKTGEIVIKCMHVISSKNLKVQLC